MSSKDQHSYGTERNDAVGSFFDKTENYLGSNSVVEIRREALMHFTRGMSFEKAIDIACADGSVALSIIDQLDELTLLDLSRNMLSKARENIPLADKDKVSFLQGDFLQAELKENTYDLIICSGLLAHIQDPLAAISKISRLLKEGGFLFLQNTDDRHLYSGITRFTQKVKSLFRKEPYPLNRVPGKLLLSQCQDGGLRLLHSYSSIVSFLFFSRWINEQRKKSIILALFGHPGSKKPLLRGNDHLYFLQKKTKG